MCYYVLLFLFIHTCSYGLRVGIDLTNLEDASDVNTEISNIFPSATDYDGLSDLSLLQGLSDSNCSTFSNKNTSQNRIQLKANFSSANNQIGISSSYGKKGTDIFYLQNESNPDKYVGYHLVFLGISTQITKKQSKNHKPLKASLKKGDHINLNATQSFTISNAIVGRTYTIEFAVVLPPFSPDITSGYESYCSILRENELRGSVDFAISALLPTH